VFHGVRSVHGEGADSSVKTVKQGADPTHVDKYSSKSKTETANREDSALEPIVASERTRVALILIVKRELLLESRLITLN
jgi:hypothetical protein